MRAHPGRISMTLVAIVLGVAFVVATWVVSDSAAETVGNANSRTDLAARVSSPRDTELTAAERDRLAALPGVQRAIGVLIGHSSVVQADGKLGDTYWPGEGGTNWDSSARFTLASGRGPESGGEVALEQEAAADAGLTVGSSAKVLNADGEPTTMTVVGIFSYRKAGASEVSPAVAYDPATAAARLGSAFAWIDLYGTDQTQIASAASGALGSGFDVRTGAELAVQRQQQADEEAQLVRNFLLAFAGVALLAGMFVIANTFTMLVAQRTRHFALLRAVGARRRQVRRAVLAEAAVLGLVGATIGVALGIGLGWLTMEIIPTTGEAVVFAVSPMAPLVGYLVGVLVTVVAAYGSARRGAAVAPVAALGTDAALPKRSLVIRTVAGCVAMSAGVVAVVATSGPALTDAKRAVGMAGALTGWLAVILLAPLLASAVLIPLSRLVSRRGSAVSRLAVRNAIRDPRRTAATASALMIGLALVTAFATVGASLTSYITGAIETDVPADTLIVQSAQGFSSISPTLVEKVRAVSGVDSVASPTESFAEFTHQGREYHNTITALEADSLGRALTPVIEAGRADLTQGVLVSSADAKEQGISLGDTLTINGVTAPVVGLYGESEILHGIVVNKTLLPPDPKSYLGAVYVSGASRSALDAAFADRPDIVVLDRAGLLAEYTEPLDLALGIIYALLAAAVIIAVFGVVNTLALSVLERTREIGVFRAVGATRSLVRRSVRRESVVIATYGGLLGVGVGILLGGVMQHVIIGTPIFDLTIPKIVVAGALGGMIVVGVLAALWPARRAARTDILAAIATA
ncbi:ABC transporter permease [Rhizocola hellebori]|nr:ABC transporter permease [Rhizocola hellebori]